MKRLIIRWAFAKALSEETKISSNIGQSDYIKTMNNLIFVQCAELESTRPKHFWQIAFFESALKRNY